MFAPAEPKTAPSMKLGIARHVMKRINPLSAFLAVALAVVVHFLPRTAARAAEAAIKPGTAEVNQVCPISGKPVDPKITTVYEGRTYAFAEEACRTKWREARENSLYQKLGGQPAIDAAVEAFYVKVLADNRIKHYFEDINM